MQNSTMDGAVLEVSILGKFKSKFCEANIAANQNMFSVKKLDFQPMRIHFG